MTNLSRCGLVPYVGSKAQLVKKLLEHMPKHKIYVEAFGGSARLLFAKPPAPVEIYNDIDKRLVNLFKTVISDDFEEHLCRPFLLTPHSRYVFLKSCGKEDPYSFFTYSCQKAPFFPFTKTGTGKWELGKTLSHYYLGKTLSHYYNELLLWIESLIQMRERLKNVKVFNENALTLIPKWDSPDTFFYLDPPYISDYPTKDNVYQYEMKRREHEKLVQLLLTLKGKVLLTMSPNLIYERLTASGWQKVLLQTTRFVGKRTILWQYVWRNF